MEAAYSFIQKFGDQVLKCSSCGFCQLACPIFELTQRPSINARGKMMILKEVIEGTLPLDRELEETLFQCTTCARCVKNCPAGLEVPEIIKQVRKDMVAAGAAHPTFQGLHDLLLHHTNIYGEKARPDFGREKNKKAAVVFFLGCVGAYRSPEATEQTLKLLDRLKVDYTLIDEVCCGGALEDVGYQAHDPLVNRNLESILATGAGTIITACPYCFRTFSHLPQYAELNKQGVQVLHLVQFLKEVDFGVTTSRTVTYHDPCDLGRHSGLYEEPRAIIRKLSPHFVEMAHQRVDSLCCGAGGGMRGAYPAHSIAIAQARLDEAVDCGAEVLLTGCPSCVQNLVNAKMRYTRLRKQPLEICTITEFINRLLEEADEQNRQKVKNKEQQDFL